MITIYKYPVEIDKQIIIMMPWGAKFLCIQVQNGVPCIWVQVDTDEALVERKFFWYGTGNPSDMTKNYLGTIQLHNGNLVFHLFE